MDSSKYIFLYVLLCDNKKYYIGITNKIKSRIKNHLDGNGSFFTRINKPIKLIELFLIDVKDWREAEMYESYKTIEYANKHGIINVAGGIFTLKDDKRECFFNEVIKNNKFKNSYFFKSNEEYNLDNILAINKIESCRINHSDESINEKISDINFIIKENNSIKTKIDNPKYKDDFLLKLKILRKQRGVKINQLSKTIGISKHVISKIENGNNNTPYSNVVKIVEALGLEIVLISERKK